MTPYEKYRTGESQYLRYYAGLVAFLKEPLNTLYVPTGITPNTAEIDMRALFQDMARNPDKYLNLNVPRDVYTSFHFTYALKSNDQGVYAMPRLRKARNTYRRSAPTVSGEKAQPVIIHVEQPALVQIPQPQFDSLQAEVQGLYQKASDNTSLRHVSNARAVIAVCRCIRLHCFDGPVKFEGVMSDEQLASYSERYPDLAFVVSADGQHTLIM